MTQSDPLQFAPLPRKVLTSEQACVYLLLDHSHPGDVPRQLRALRRLVDTRKLLRATLYRKERSYLVSDLDAFLSKCRKGGKSQDDS